MRWQSALIDRLARVRDVRMRLAELELQRADEAVAAARAAEDEAQQAVIDATSRRVSDIKQADDALLAGRSGGARGINDWRTSRRQAEIAVQNAQVHADESASQRLEAELASSSARATWRTRRLDAERLALLIEHSGNEGRG